MRAALMRATMLAGGATLSVAMPQTALAQVVEGPVQTFDGQSEFYIGSLVIGSSSNGELRLLNSDVRSATGLLGQFAGSKGIVTVDGGSRWTASNQLVVGQAGTGTLTISDGGTVSSNEGVLGLLLGSTGTATVTGAGSSWTSSSQLSVGSSATGTLNISDGGAVSADRAFIARNASSSGTLNFGAAAGGAAVAPGTLNAPTIQFGSGTGTIVFNHTDDDFELDRDISGEGTVRLLSGRTILSGDNTFTGSTLLEGGTLTLGSDTALGGSTLRTTGSIVDYADGVTITNPITIDSDTTQFQVLTGSATQSGVISEDNGPRPFEKIGDGDLILTADNTWTGATTITGGTLTFDDGSVALAASQDLTIGDQSGDNGALVIRNSGEVSNSSGLIANFGGSTGTATITGEGASWTNSATLFVGTSGAGSLTISDGGTVSNTFGHLGLFAGSTGTANVTGTGSSWTSSRPLYVGNAGTGTLTISDGGRVSSNGGFVAAILGSTGTATVAGAGSSWTNSGGLYVGNRGEGTLTISNGGEVSNTDGFIANNTGSTGTANVTGAGSTWNNSGSLFVGGYGAGSLTISDGGTVNSDSGIFASEAGSSGTANVTGAGSAWTNSGNLFVGSSGAGSLSISDGGTVSSNNGNLGFFSGATGTATVTGAGSSWTNSGVFVVGSGGDGTLTISDGGTVSNTFGYLGPVTGSTGTATVTGAGSSWTNSSQLFVGREGTGTLTISDGGTVSNSQSDIGSGASGAGVVAVTGAGSSWINSSSLEVGMLGTGTLTISDGGEVSSVIGILGDEAGSIGAATVTGAGSSWANSVTLTVGNRGAGTLTLSDGGAVSATGAFIARNAGSTGTLNVGAAAGDAAVAAGVLDSDTLAFGPGDGDLVFNHTAALNGAGYAFDAGMESDGAGDALIRQLAGFTRLTGDSAGYQGALTVDGGRVSVDGVLGSGAVTAHVGAGGSLTGTGTLAGDVSIAAGGALTGQSGTMFSIGGDLTLAEGTSVDVSLSGPVGSELFAVDGDLTLDGALNITDAGGFGPGLYALFTYDGALTDNGLEIGTTPFSDLLQGELRVQTSVAGAVNLVSSRGADLLFWDGDAAGGAANGVVDGGAGVWSADGATFTDAQGLVSGPSRPAPGFVIFSGAAGEVSVDGAQGDIAITGAQFAVDGYKVTGDAITLAGDGEALIRVGDGTASGSDVTATIDSALTGDATLVKTDLGTLLLGGENTYAGGTEVRAGTLIGSTGSIRGDVLNAGTVAFDQSGDASLDRTLSGTGLFRFTGGAAFTLTGQNSYSGGTEVSGSTLVVETGAAVGTGGVALSDARLVYADQVSLANDLTVSGDSAIQVRSGAAIHTGALSGSGRLTVEQGGAFTFAGDGRALTGETVIAGDMLVNGVLGGVTEVIDGGVLRGFGTLGSTRLMAGSTIAPGNSVGTLTIDGDLVFEAGALYEATALPDGRTDLIDVTGRAILNGGSVLAVGAESGFGAFTTYSILSADGGIEGRFDRVDSSYAFLDAALAYGEEVLTLEFTRNDIDFASLAETPNQGSVARAADTLGPDSDIWNALVTLDGPTAPGAFEALSGELHATQRQMLIEGGDIIRREALGRIRSMRGDVENAVWAGAYTGAPNFGSRPGAASADGDVTGAMFGLDGAVSSSLRVGAFAAYGDGDTRLEDRGAQASTDSTTLGAYAGGDWMGLALGAGATYSWHAIESARTVTFPGVRDLNTASYDAEGAQLFLDAGLPLGAGVEPFVQISHARLDLDPVLEVGGESALGIAGETRQSTRGTIGARYTAERQAGAAMVGLDLEAGWRHVFSGDRQYAAGTFVDAPVYFEGAGVDRGALNLTGALTVEVSRLKMSLGYFAETGTRSTTQGADIRVRVAF